MIDDDLPRREPLTHPLRLSFLLLTALFFVASGFFLLVRYQTRLDLAQNRLASLRNVYSENTLLINKSIESLMRAVQAEVKQGVRGEELHEFLVSTAARLPQLRTLLYIDADGIAAGDSRPDQPAIGISAADRTYFLVHQDAPTAMVYVDDPVQSRIDGNWSMPFTMGIWDDGEFLGITATSVDPTYFSGPLNYLSPNDMDLYGYIINARGRILTTIPYDPEHIGKSITNRTVLSYLDTEILSDLFQGEGMLSDEQHLLAFTQLENEQLAVIFEQPVSDINTGLFIDITVTLAGLVALSGATYLGLSWQSRQSQRVVEQANLVQRERNIMRTLIDNIPDTVYIKDAHGQILLTNDLDSSSIGSITNDEQVSDADILASGGGIINAEQITRDPAGKKHWTLTTKVPLVDTDTGNVTGLVGIVRDVTKQREAQEEILEAERMRVEVEHEREVVAMKQQFISTATHDFRTPLAVIRTSVDLLLNYSEHMDDARRQGKLERISEQIDHMLSLMEGVLTLSKADAGKLKLTLATIELRPFCEKIWQDMLDAQQDVYDTVLDVATRHQTFVADEQMLQLALINLLSNAFKYTPTGGKIRLIVRDEDEMLLFEIQDSGKGIPEKDQKRLFEPFFRASNTGDISGTGLGLVIAMNYVELHGGTISMQSEEHVGTTMIVRVPLIQT